MLTFIDLNQTKPGGLQVLLVNLISELADRNIKTKLYSSKRSYVYRQLRAAGLKFNHIDSDNITIKNLDQYIHSSDTLVISSLMKQLFYFKESKPKFIYWVLLPNFEGYSYFTLCNGRIRIKMFEGLMRKFIGEMISSMSLYFMDGSTLKDTERIYGEIASPHYIPIPMKRMGKNLFHNKSENSIVHGTVRVTYLGRGSALWKIYPIVHFVEGIIKMNTSAKFSLLIVTDTDEKYKQALGHLASEKLSISYNLHVDHNELEEFLLANSDLHVAMGTSALDGAKLGIPTILIDASDRPFPDDYKYRWIYESNTDYTLGYWINKDTDYLKRGSSLSCLLDRYLVDKSYKMEISDQCFDYVRKYHDINNILKQVLDASDSTSSDVTIFNKFNPLFYNIRMRYLIKEMLK
jgi:hypothetical protein